MLSRFTAGDLFEVTTTLADYPAGEGWALTYRLIPRDGTGAAIQIDCSASGDDHVASQTTTATSAWQPGEYSWVSYVTLGAARHTVDRGQITIAPNAAALTAASDLRTENEIALADALKALREWNPTRKRFRIGEREVEFNSSAEILTKISILRTEVRRELRRSCAGRPSCFRRPLPRGSRQGHLPWHAVP
jgi:hypothetical protein